MNEPDRPIASALMRLRSVVRLSRLTFARLKNPGTLEVGEGFALGQRSTINSPDFFRADRSVHVGPEFFCESNVIIGPDVLVSSRVSFVGNDHDLEHPSAVGVFDSPRRPAATVVLEGNNLVGHGTVVLGDVRVGRGTIVGAGSLVTTDLPPNSICFGRPARVVRARVARSPDVLRGG